MQSVGSGFPHNIAINSRMDLGGTSSTCHANIRSSSSELLLTALVLAKFRADLNVELAAFALLGLCNSVLSARIPPRPFDVEVLINEFSGMLTNGVVSERANRNAT